MSRKGTYRGCVTTVPTSFACCVG